METFILRLLTIWSCCPLKYVHSLVSYENEFMSHFETWGHFSRPCYVSDAPIKSVLFMFTHRKVEWRNKVHLFSLKCLCLSNISRTFNSLWTNKVVMTFVLCVRSSDYVLMYHWLGHNSFIVLLLLLFAVVINTNIDSRERQREKFHFIIVMESVCVLLFRFEWQTKSFRNTKLWGKSFRDSFLICSRVQVFWWTLLGNVKKLLIFINLK